MITGYSFTTTTPDIEEMSVSGELSPEHTNAQIYIRRADLTVEQQAIYSNAVNIVSGKFFTNITNTTSNLVIDRATSELVTEGTSDFDFETMSVADQDALRALLGLFVVLDQLPELV